ncbi:MAG TPA: endopeptidase [Burkholderiaceae bacterium]
MSTSDPLDLQGQQDAQAQTEARARALAALEDDDLKWLLSSKRGRRIALRWLERAGVWRLSFNTNALSMAFAEGQRNAGLGLLARITLLVPERYSEMLKENAA